MPLLCRAELPSLDQCDMPLLFECFSAGLLALMVEVVMD
jgi:hypothetical protein